MRVLLTGATGFVGRHVAAELTAAGVEAIRLGRGVAGADAIVLDLLSEDPAPAIVGRGFTHLIHCAWTVEHGAFWSAPVNARWVEATTRLIEAFADAGGRHVTAVGTQAEYDATHGWLREDTTPLAPTTFYGVAKDATRRLAQGVGLARGVGVAWARLFLLYGAGEAPTRLAPSMRSWALGTRAPFAYAAGLWRDFLHVSDAAAGLVALSRAEARGAFNVCSGAPVTLEGFASAMWRAVGSDPAEMLTRAAPRPSEPRLVVGDPSRIEALGWRPRLDLEAGLARFVEADRRADEEGSQR